MPADALAPLGARPSAGTVMTEVLSHICMGPAMESEYIPKISEVSESQKFLV